MPDRADAEPLSAEAAAAYGEIVTALEEELEPLAPAERRIVLDHVGQCVGQLRDALCDRASPELESGSNAQKHC